MSILFLNFFKIWFLIFIRFAKARAHWVVFLFTVFKNSGFLFTEIGLELNLLIKFHNITIINTLGSNKSSHFIDNISKELLCMICPSSQRRGRFSIFTNNDRAISCLFKCILSLQIRHWFFSIEFWQKCGNWCLPRANWGMSSIEIVVFHCLTRWARSHNDWLIHLIKNSFLPDREVSCVVHAQTEWWCFL